MAHLHMVCGLICAGKSTLCASLSEQPDTVLISEDSWLSALYGPEMETIADYVTYSQRLQTILTPHIQHLLGAHINVVLDFPANTLPQRAWFRGLIDSTGSPHTLHLLDVPADICKQRLTARNNEGTHAFSVTERQFDLISAHFTRPTADEGFKIKTHQP